VTRVRAVVGCLMVALLPSACSTSTAIDLDIVPSTTTTVVAVARPPITRVVLIGDSLAQEVESNLAFLIGDLVVVPKFFGGTAACDWLDDDLDVTPDSAVVITFTGNSQTECMSDGAGGYLRGTALVARYQQDVATLIERALAAGGQVLLVGQPARGGDPLGAAEVDGLNQIYRAMATATAVQFVDAGATVENPDGSFAERLPCSPIEPECDDDGTNAVRSDDGVHFCPGDHDVPCPHYSSGSLRFALSIAEAVTHLDRSAA
jgi:hypothetical protein